VLTLCAHIGCPAKILLTIEHIMTEGIVWYCRRHTPASASKAKAQYLFDKCVKELGALGYEILDSHESLEPVGIFLIEDNDE